MCFSYVTGGPYKLQHGLRGTTKLLSNPRDRGIVKVQGTKPPPVFWKEVRRMKRVITLLIVAVLMLSIFTGCQSVPDDATDGTTTTPSTSDPVPSSDPEETTEPIPSTGPDTGEESLSPEEQKARYVWPPEGCTVFLFDGELSPFNPYRDQIDTVGLTAGILYIYREAENTCIPVCPKQVAAFEATKDHIYYILKNEPGKVYRTDYTHREQTALYTSGSGAIASMEYHGTDDKGKLLLCEGNKRIVLVDASTGGTEVLVEQEGIAFCWYEYTVERQGFSLKWFDADDDVWTLDWETGAPVKMEGVTRRNYYRSAPEELFVFNYNGYHPSPGNYKNLTASGLTEGVLYVYHEQLDRVFTIAPILDFYAHVETLDYLYYIPADAPNQIVRTDYAGEERTVIYESKYGQISSFGYWGTDANGKLILCEAERYAVLYDIAAGSREVLLEKENMQSWGYAYGNAHYPPEYEGRWFIHIRCKDWEWWIIDPDTGELIRHIVEGP